MIRFFWYSSMACPIQPIVLPIAKTVRAPPGGILSARAEPRNQLQQRLPARIAVRIQRMSESRDDFAAFKPGRHDGPDARRRPSLLEKRFHSLGGSPVLDALQGRQAGRHDRVRSGAG